MSGDAALHDAMLRAVAESRAAAGLSSPNPPVGAVIIGERGEVIATGHTQAAGGPHAEVMALAAAGERARGATAVVTLEPCNHTGRTGPCAQALIDAGIARVVYAVGDPNPQAAGGARRLHEAGIEVVSGVAAAAATEGPLRGWLHRQRTGRPLVIAKIAATIDGRTAAPDGSSQWITGDLARADAHDVRSGVDAIIVGTGTVLADDPSLTARTPEGTPHDRQPVRVVLGHRDVPDSAKIRDAAAPTQFVDSHDPIAALTAVPDALTVLVDGGSTVLGAFLGADLIDEIHLYLAPMVLGAGANALTDPTVTTLTQSRRYLPVDLRQLGDDLRWTLRRGPGTERAAS